MKGQRTQNGVHQPSAECVALMRHLMGSKGIRTKQAAEVGRRAVDYFRSADFVKWVKDNANVLCEELPFFAQLVEEESLDQGVLMLGAEMLQRGLIYRASPSVLSDSNNSTEKGSSGKSGERAKWPKRLEVASNQSFESENAFYVISYEGSKIGSHAVLGLIIAAVLLVCMFPAWPLAVKLATWYCSVVILTAILAIVVCRLVLFVLLWFFGMDFWWFPNLFNEDVGVIDSFKPFHSFQYRNDGWLMMLVRIFCCLLSIAGIWQLGQTHSISDINQFARRQFLDIIDWGHQKLSPPPDVAQLPPDGIDPLLQSIRSVGRFGTTRPHAPRMGPSNTEEKNQQTPDEETTEVLLDYTCLRKCGFKTYEELSEECYTHCTCMRELLESPCYKKCPEDVQRILSEEMTDICTRGSEEEVEMELQTSSSDATGAGPANDEL